MTLKLKHTIYNMVKMNGYKDAIRLLRMDGFDSHSEEIEYAISIKSLKLHTIEDEIKYFSKLSNACYIRENNTITISGNVSDVTFKVEPSKALKTIEIMDMEILGLAFKVTTDEMIIDVFGKNRFEVSERI